MLTLRPYQRTAIDAIYAYFEEKMGHPIVVIPTAGGKSLVLAAFIKEVLEQWPDQRILIVTNVRELIAQNFAEMIRIWPDAPAGIYSAGLGKRDIGARILFAGIQSIHNRAYDVQQCDLVLVDEAHLIPRTADTRYRRFLNDLSRINPHLKIIGLTATPYRLDSGMLHEGKDALFTDIAFDVSVRDLIEQGYLSPLISKAADTQLDVVGVGVRGGEFIASQLQHAVDVDAITQAAVDEVVHFGKERRSWLLFCSAVDHARHVAEGIAARGISVATVFGDTPERERDGIIADFKSGNTRALASMGVLTTGFNAPAVDLIAMLRPTKSAGLYVQMVGRGARLAEGKSDCLVLDFAGNVKRHGPIDAVKAEAAGDGEGEAPVKTCPDCRSIIHASVRTCPDCGHAFPPPELKIDSTATTLAVLSTSKPEWVPVSDVAYHRHQKEGRTPSLRVDYRCGLLVHREWVCIEHMGFPRQKAVAWWMQRAPDLPVPSSVDDAIAQANRLRAPTEIAVRPNGKFLEVVGARFS